MNSLKTRTARGLVHHGQGLQLGQTQELTTKLTPTCSTRDPKVLDHRYTNVKNAYHSIVCPHFNKSDHKTMLLLPAYKQKLKRENPSTRVMQCWSEELDD